MDKQQDQPPRKINISEVFKKYQGQLKSFIAKRVTAQEDREDILQDVFYQLLKTDPVAPPVQQISAWLYTVTRNLIIDRKRKTASPNRRGRNVYLERSIRMSLWCGQFSGKRIHTLIGLGRTWQGLGRTSRRATNCIRVEWITELFIQRNIRKFRYSSQHPYFPETICRSISPGKTLQYIRRTTWRISTSASETVKRPPHTIKSPTPLIFSRHETQVFH